MNEIPQELINILDTIKLQNERLFEMQEEQLKWNKQHSINLTKIIEKLNEMYLTIKEFKEKKNLENFNKNFNKKIENENLNKNFNQKIENEKNNENKNKKILINSFQTTIKSTPIFLL